MPNQFHNHFDRGHDTVGRMDTLVRIATTEVKFTLDRLEAQPLSEDEMYALNYELGRLVDTVRSLQAVAEAGLQRFPKPQR